MSKGISYSVNNNAKCDPVADKALGTLGTKRREPAREAEKKMQRMTPMERIERRMRVGEKIDTKY